MDDLKPCPFCGKESCYVDADGMNFGEPAPDVSCTDPRCMPMSTYVPVDTWQNRPIEEGLRAELAQAQARMKELEAENLQLRAYLEKARLTGELFQSPEV